MAGRLALGMIWLLSSPVAAAPLSCASFSVMDSIERPKPPTCTGSMSYNPQQYEIDECRGEMEQYIRKMKDYLQCLQDEYQEALTANNNSVHSFNCAIGGLSC